MPAPECPRCAYDLSGITRSWHDSCPLSGHCSECGLTFAWRDVVAGPYKLPRWSFEHATPNRLIPAFFATLVRALMPHRLWSGLRMEMRISTGRLKAFVACGLLLTKLLGVLLLGVPCFTALYIQGVRWGGRTDPVEPAIPLLWPYAEFGGWWRSDSFISPWALITILTTLTVPVAFLLLPVSLRRAKVSGRHFVRIQAYNLAILPWIVGMWAFLHAAALILDEFQWDFFWRLGMDSEEGFQRTVGLLCLAWTGAILLWSWCAAVKLYLRLPHALAVAGAMIAIATLASTLAVVLLYGHALF